MNTSAESAHQERTLSCTGRGGIACTQFLLLTLVHGLHMKDTHPVTLESCSFCILRPCGHHLLRAFASVYSLSWSVRNEPTEITIPTAVYGVGGMDNEVTQSLVLWSAELGGSSCLVPIKMVLQGAGVTVGCLSWHTVLNGTVCGGDAQGTTWLLHSAWFIFSLHFMSYTFY